MKTDILYLNGTYYENGKKSGEYFKNRVDIDTEKVNKILKNEKIRNKVFNQLINLKRKYPNFYEEVVGKSLGLGLDLLTYFAILCPEITDINFEHCTTITCKKDDENFIISHNEDDDYIEGNFCLSKVKIDDDNWFVTNDMYNMPFGNGISWNSFGIVKTINYCHNNKVIEENFPRYFLQRYISESTSIDDMIERCKEMKVASGFHINVIDIYKNMAASIEVYVDGVDVFKIDDYYIHTNHFIHGSYLNNPSTDFNSNSCFRLNKAHELFSEANLYKVQEVLSYRSKDDLFQNSILQTKKDPYITLFNFSYDTSNKEKIYLNSYTNNEKIELDYDL